MYDEWAKFLLQSDSFRGASNFLDCNLSVNQFHDFLLMMDARKQHVEVLESVAPSENG